MKFPLGQEIYKRTPVYLINLKELISWFRLERFNGVLVEEVSNVNTQVLVYDGIIPKAFTERNGEILAEDSNAIEIFVNDYLARNGFLSLFSYDKELIPPLLILYFSTPNIFREESYLFIPERLIEDSKKENSISHILIENSEDKVHFLFYDGKFKGYYSEKDGIIKEDISFLSELFNKSDSFISFYQISCGEFHKLNIPSLKFSFIEEEITKWVEKLLEYVNFIMRYYESHGMYIKNTNKILDGLNILGSSLVCLDRKFIIKKEIMGSYEEVEGEIVEVIRRINRELSDLWGEKFVHQKYIQGYKKFIEEYKNDKKIIELLDEINLENIEF
ncbi:hypothetical protein [Dictyoglomus turgidum]|uniref:hypothetical protein n=1 Tax=Dictyoglomus turgidum TaxID=513050 RepID=UPI0023574A03|nr:hypothetical protein [Dictyoglomus turgidum]